MKTFVLLAMLLVSGRSFGECFHDPFAIVSAQKFRDGGTVIASVTDSAGCQVEFRYDGKMDSPTRGRIYLNGRLSRGSEEHRLLRLVAAVIDSSRSRIEREESLGIESDDERDRIQGQAFFLEEMLDKCGWQGAGPAGAVGVSEVRGPDVLLEAGEREYRVKGRSLTVDVLPLEPPTDGTYLPCISCSPDGSIWYRCLTPLSHVTSIMAVTRQSDFSMAVVDATSSLLETLEFQDIGPGWYHMRFSWAAGKPPGRSRIFVLAQGDTLGELRYQD